MSAKKRITSVARVVVISAGMALGWISFGRVMVCGGEKMMPLAANDLALAPDEGLRFVEEPGVRIAMEHFKLPNEPDCQVFVRDGKPFLRVKDPGPNDRWRILSAVSQDGLHFEKEQGVRMDVSPSGDPPHGAIGMAKPQLVKLKGGKWGMYYAAHTQTGIHLFSAVSQDGLNWKREPGVKVVDTEGKPVHAKYPSLVRCDDCRLRMYYDGNGGIRSAVSPQVPPRPHEGGEKGPDQDRPEIP